MTDDEHFLAASVYGIPNVVEADDIEEAQANDDEEVDQAKEGDGSLRRLGR